MANRYWGRRTSIRSVIAQRGAGATVAGRFSRLAGPPRLAAVALILAAENSDDRAEAPNEDNGERHRSAGRERSDGERRASDGGAFGSVFDGILAIDNRSDRVCNEVGAIST